MYMPTRGSRAARACDSSNAIAATRSAPAAPGSRGARLLRWHSLLAISTGFGQCGRCQHRDDNPGNGGPDAHILQVCSPPGEPAWTILLASGHHLPYARASASSLWMYSMVAATESIAPVQPRCPSGPKRTCFATTNPQLGRWRPRQSTPSPRGTAQICAITGTSPETAGSDRLDTAHFHEVGVKDKACQTAKHARQISEAPVIQMLGQLR